MKILSSAARISAIVSILISAAGCGRQNAAKSIPVSVASAEVDNKFATAPADMQAVAKEAVASLKNNDLPAAFNQFRSLSGRSDLTREQRTAASQAFASTLQQTAAAAANGDTQARQVLKAYMASK